MRPAGSAASRWPACWPQEGLAAGRRLGADPSRRSIPMRRCAARPPHFPAKAKRVLMIFCSGACSHLDTWDYKPELIKRHDTPMPGARQAGHLPGQERQPDQKPLGVPPARRERQVRFGPAAEPGRAGRRDVLHPLDDLEDQHARAGRELHEHRLHARGLSERRRVGLLCPGQRVRQPAGLRGDSRSARRAAGRPEQLVERLSARRVSGHGVQRRAADRQPGHARRPLRRPPSARRATF